ncbi:Centromere protein Scm3 N-terminal [Penicillium brevicompactum]|uniref:Centromere protein Scm3 N-terminal n=1 Tax=Penicillium brevicompactum TaxID=5074 RepID=A0A9W9V5Q0_PENBR|nr:Centromere protein Scm3 N-terminal [Penicillium brevicompactum]
MHNHDSMILPAQDIEPPAKRQRLSPTLGAEHATANVSEEIPDDFDLPAARAQNDSKLKSLFEGIFAKYSHDFTDVGDEIDLETGNIVVDNGHLLGLQEEGADGRQPRSWLFQAGLEEPEGPDTDLDEGQEEEENDDAECAGSAPGDLMPNVSAPSPSVHAPPPGQPQGDDDDSLDFVFTFKASGATGLSPVTKMQHVSRPTNSNHHPTNSLNHPRTVDPVAASKPQDPIWAVPDLPQSFATPTTQTRKVNVELIPSARSPSPPGSGSVWAVRGPGRPRTESKPKVTPSRRKPSAKRKYHSSPVARDWSFASVPDGNESDDPLQDYEPSPTPSKMRIIRGKRQVPTKDPGTPSRSVVTTPSKAQVNHEKYRRHSRAPTPNAQSTKSTQPHLVSPTKSPQKGIYVAQPKSVGDLEQSNTNTCEETSLEQDDHTLVSTFADLEGDRAWEEEAKARENKSPQRSQYKDIFDSAPIASIESDRIEVDERKSAQGNGPPNTQFQADTTLESTLGPESTPVASTKVPSAEPPQTSPSKRRIMTPDEAKVILRVMHQENKKAIDVVKLMPTLDYQTVWHWYFNHWTRRLAHPPHLSAPWSHSELATFTRLSSQSGLCWAKIQREFSGRSRAEVEFELLRAFVDGRASSAEEHPTQQPSHPASEQLSDSSQEVWVQAEEMKIESESTDGALHSVERADQYAHSDSPPSPSTTEGRPGKAGHVENSYVSNALLELFK